MGGSISPGGRSPFGRCGRRAHCVRSGRPTRAPPPHSDGADGAPNTACAPGDQCAQLLESALFAPFLASLRESPLAVWLDTAAWAQLPLFFWRNALRRVCEGRLGVGLIKEKPLRWCTPSS